MSPIASPSKGVRKESGVARLLGSGKLSFSFKRPYIEV